MSLKPSERHYMNRFMHNKRFRKHHMHRKHTGFGFFLGLLIGAVLNILAWGHPESVWLIAGQWSANLVGFSGIWVVMGFNLACWTLVVGIIGFFLNK